MALDQELSLLCKKGGKNLSGLSMCKLCITLFFSPGRLPSNGSYRNVIFFVPGGNSVIIRPFSLVLGCRKSMIKLIRLIYSHRSYLNASYPTRKPFFKKRMKADERNQRWIAFAQFTPASTCLYKMGNIGTSSTTLTATSRSQGVVSFLSTSSFFFFLNSPLQKSQPRAGCENVVKHLC